WSPDRTRVAFLRGRADEPCRLMVIPVPPDDVPGPEREIARCPAAGPVTLSWTGGHGLAVTSAPGGWGSEGWPGATLGAQARRAVAQFGSAAKAAATRFAGPAAPERAAARAPLLEVGLAAPAPRVAPFARPGLAKPGADAAPPDRDPAWSPDGRTLAYVAGEPGAEEIWLAPADGPPRRLTRLSAGRLSGLAWSPDGRRIAAVAHAPGGAADLVVADALTGTAVALTDGPAPEASPAWSADGRRLHFAAERGGVWRAWRMEPHAGAEAEPVSGPGVRSVRSDAAHLYLRRADGAVSRRPHAGGEEEPVLPAGGGLDPAVWQLAAGALWLVERPVGRGPARLVRLDAATGTRETMAELPGLLPDGIAVRPDGRGALVAGLRTAR
ncbi:MAG TPA: hypothetical protein VEB20_10820, partial [Azospirillaceae bacterium]|nr:hypothetical protein [Azospirillaceae bacterium]